MQGFRSTAPHRAGRDLLIRALAHKLQEQVYGGLSQSARRRLRSLAKPDGEPGKQAAQTPPSLRPGVRLVREWDRQVHEVYVCADGFDYRGERYRSLTQIARHITGAHWSGPRFFGIAAATKQRSAAAAGKVSVDAAG